MSNEPTDLKPGIQKKALLWIGVWAFLLGLLLFSVLVILLVQVLNQEAIHDAARSGNVERVKDILDRNPGRLEQRSRMELTPLHDAAWHGETAVLQELVRRGADANAKWDLASTGDGDWNALHITAIQGHMKAAEVLIAGGTDINWKTMKGETPLDVANRNGNRELAALLREHGGKSGNEP